MNACVPLVAGISTALGLWAVLGTTDDGLGLIPNLVNFGALIAFLMLHVSVVVHYLVRNKSRNYFSHLVSPLLGAAILVAVVLNAKIFAQRVGVGWIGAGVLILVVLYASGRKPRMSGFDADRTEPANPVTGASAMVAEADPA